MLTDAFSKTGVWGWHPGHIHQFITKQNSLMNSNVHVFGLWVCTGTWRAWTFQYKRFWMWIVRRFGPKKDPLTEMINLKIWHDVYVLDCEWQIIVTLSIPLFHMFLPPDHLSWVKSNCLSVLSLFVCFILECKEWIRPKDPRYNSIRHTFRGLIKNIHICMCLSVLQRWH